MNKCNIIIFNHLVIVFNFIQRLNYHLYILCIFNFNFIKTNKFPYLDIYYLSISKIKKSIINLINIKISTFFHSIFNSSFDK